MSEQLEQVLAIVLIMMIFLVRRDNAVVAKNDDGAQREFDQTNVKIQNEIKDNPTQTKAEDRRNQMDELFDLGWNEGHRTYAGLIDYVRQKTGEGTSKTRVKSWKEKRGLLNA